MYRSVMVPLDRSSFAEQALQLALSIARRANARLDLVEVPTLYALEELHGGWQAYEPGRDADHLLVMATHACGPLGRALLGSVVDKVIRNCTIPVLIIKPQGRTFDLTELPVLTGYEVARHL